MDIIFGLFWLGLVIFVALAIFGIAFGLFVTVISVVISIVGWVWEKITKSE